MRLDCQLGFISFVDLKYTLALICVREANLAHVSYLTKRSDCYRPKAQPESLARKNPTVGI